MKGRSWIPSNHRGGLNLELALIVALLVLVCVAALGFLGGSIANRLDNSAHQVDGNSAAVEEVATTYTLTYAAGSGGTISGTSPQTVNSGGSGTVITAVPNTGYSFVSWSDGVMTAERTDTVIMADLSVGASFTSTATQYMVNFDSNGGGVASGYTGVRHYPVNDGSSFGATMPVAPTRTGYTFNGWNTAINGSGSSFTSSTTVNGPLTVYAQWTNNQ